MNTPNRPDQDLTYPLYGAEATSINRFGITLARRSLLAGALALPFAAHAQTTDDPVARAKAAMGGAALLARVKALNWFGRAQINTGDQIINMMLRSHIEPFGRVRTDSWLAGDTSTMRSMLLLPEGGVLMRGETASELSRARTLHEVQQYAIYGYMLISQPGVSLANDGGRVAAAHAGLPPIRFTINQDGFLDAADYVVASPDGIGTIAEHLRFDGKLSDQGVNWPATIFTLQNGMPYMTLTLEQFSVELA